MAKVHRHLVDRLGQPPVNAVLLDSPYGLQENVTKLPSGPSATFGISGFRSTSPPGVPQIMCLARERALARIADADYVFSGPGSPTYALGLWDSSPLPDVLAGRLAELAVVRARDPRQTVAPFVETLLEVRQQVRQQGSYALADTLRDRLLAAGVEVRDTPRGPVWMLSAPPGSDSTD